MARVRLRSSLALAANLLLHAQLPRITRVTSEDRRALQRERLHNLYVEACASSGSASM